jgi:hypothetical protein
MIVVAVAALVMAAGVEAPRLYRRWLWCREQAMEHAQEALRCRSLEQQYRQKMDRLTAIARRFRAQGPAVKRDLAALVQDSGDPSFFSGWFSPPSKLQLLYAPRREPEPSLARLGRLAPGIDLLPYAPASELDWLGPVYPVEAADWLELYWGRWWREAGEEYGRLAADRTAKERAYLRAAARPWLALPRPSDGAPR